MHCEKCNTIFTDKNKLRLHKSRSCKAKTCPHCKATFTRVRDLNKHLNNRKKITCDHCSKHTDVISGFRIL